MRKGGYVVIVAAMVAYAIAAVFLDFYEEQGMPAGVRGVSYFDLLTLSDPRPRATLYIGAVVTVFGGAFLIAATATLALIGSRDGRRTRTTVSVAVGVWSTFVLGPAITIGTRDFPVGTGFWVQASCAVVAIVGVLMLWGRQAPEAPDEPVSGEAAATVPD
jgi:MFS family permease